MRAAPRRGAGGAAQWHGTESDGTRAPRALDLARGLTYDAGPTRDARPSRRGLREGPGTLDGQELRMNS